MKEVDIFKEIKRIAGLLQENNQFMTKKELADSLRSYGVEKDSLELNNLITSPFFSSKNAFHASGEK